MCGTSTCKPRKRRKTRQKTRAITTQRKGDLTATQKKRGSTATKTRAAEEVCVVEELSFGRKDQYRLMHPARRADKTKKKRR
jgi:hypothetical protein